MCNEKVGESRNYIVGLLCHYLFSDGSAQYIFLDVDDGQLTVVNRSLSFCSEINLHICASCNGLLLFSSVRDNVVHYNVFNLFAKQSVALPLPQITRRSIRTGLAFDGQHYQVVRVFSVKDVKGSIAESSSAGAVPAWEFLEMEIFSSETGIWRQYRPLIRLPPDLPKLSTTPLFSNGAIHWELGGYLLIYFVNNGHCKLIKLPNFCEHWLWRSMTFGQCLWESEGHVHYCYSDFKGIHTWILLTEQERNYYFYYHAHDRDKFEWKLADSILHETLISLNPDIFLRIGQRKEFSQWKPYFVSPRAYNFQTLYLRLPGVVVSYNLKTRTLKQICSFTFPNTNFYCCMIFPVAYGLQGEHQTENDKAASGMGDVALPIADEFGSSCGSSEA